MYKVLLQQQTLKTNSIGRDGGGDWFRIFGTNDNGTALYNGLSVNETGGLSVGKWQKIPQGQFNALGSAGIGGDMPQDWTGLNVKRRDGRWTHFDWKDDSQNYIRGNTIIDGSTNLNGPVRIPSGQPLTIRDEWHGMKFAENVDGPMIHGWGGGKLSSTQKDNAVDILRWNREGVFVDNGKFCVKDWCAEQHDNKNLHVYNRRTGNLNDWILALTPDKTVHTRRAVNNQNNA
jgi:hypothetical protein